MSCRTLAACAGTVAVTSAKMAANNLKRRIL
jgi:hypothetical protein